MKIYCIFNELDNEYQGVFSSETDLKAKLRIREILGKSDTYRYVSLCRIGTFEPETGLIKESNSPIRVEKYVEPSQIPIDDINKEIEKK